MLYYDFNTPGAAQTSAGSNTLTLTTQVGGVATNKISVMPIGPDGTTVLNLSGATQNTILSGSVSGMPEFTTGIGSFTIAFWIQGFNHSSTGNERVLQLRRASGSEIAIDLSLGRLAGTTTSQMLLAVNGSSTVGSAQGIAGTPINLTDNGSDGAWHFVAVTYNASDGSVVFYKNGTGGTLVSAAPGAKLTAPKVTTSEMLYVGNALGGGRLLDANLDNLAFYNRVLTQSELTSIYHSVPEPSSLAVTGVGLIAMVVTLRKKRRKL